MSDLYDWIRESEPVNEARIYNKFGRDGLDELGDLIQSNKVFVSRSGNYWVVGKGGWKND